MKFCPLCHNTYPDLENVCPSDGTILYLKDLFHLVGTTIAEQYTLEALAGIGGMSAVYRAHHRKMERDVAFKILLPHLTLNDPEMVRLFEREARAAGQIIHPNVATIYDAGRTSEELVYIVMEWLQGHTLEKVLKQNAPLDWETVGIIMQQLTAGLDAAHQLNIVHRDLKPGNVMILPETHGPMRVKILDFGVAKINGSEADNFVSTAVGTVQYASPEQMVEGHVIDTRTDIYSLGVILYEMVTGTLPFDSGDIQSLMHQHLLDEPPALSLARPDTPPAIVELVASMLAKHPAERPATAGEAWQVMERALLHRRQAAKATIQITPENQFVSPSMRAAEPQTIESDDVRSLLIEGVAVKAESPSRGSKGRAIACVVMVILLAALALGYKYLDRLKHKLPIPAAVQEFAHHHPLKI